MIRALAFFFSILALSGWLAGTALAQTFPLLQGAPVTGEPIAPDARGVIIKKGEGNLTERIAWTNFTQSALKMFADMPKMKRFVEPLVEPEDVEVVQKAAADIKPKPVPRLERPDPKAGISALFSAPLIVVLFLILYLANIYAGYEVSIFRNYPPALGCGLAAVGPVICPAIFLCLPTRLNKVYDPAAEHAPQEHVVAEAPLEDSVEADAPPPSPSTPALPAATVYQRGQTSFNRRFFETKFAGYMRMVPSEAEKDMVIYIKSARGEHEGTRITRIMPNELYLQISKGGATTDVLIPFSEISEVQVRHKDA